MKKDFKQGKTYQAPSLEITLTYQDVILGSDTVNDGIWSPDPWGITL